MVLRLRQVEGGKIRLLLPYPKQRRKRVKIVVGEWDKDLKKLATKSDILVLAKAHDLKSSDRKGAFLVKGPGEYEVKGIFVKGVRDSGDSPVYVVDGEGTRICYIHSFSKKELETDILEEVGEVEILLSPLDRGNLPSVKRAKNIVSQIDPSIVVFARKPTKGGKRKDKIAAFLKEMDVKSFEEKDEFIFDSSDFKEDKVRFLVISDEE